MRGSSGSWSPRNVHGRAASGPPFRVLFPQAGTEPGRTRKRVHPVRNHHCSPAPPGRAALVGIRYAMTPFLFPRCGKRNRAMRNGECARVARARRCCCCCCCCRCARRAQLCQKIGYPWILDPGCQGYPWIQGARGTLDPGCQKPAKPAEAGFSVTFDGFRASYPTVRRSRTKVTKSDRKAG